MARNMRATSQCGVEVLLHSLSDWILTDLVPEKLHEVAADREGHLTALKNTFDVEHTMPRSEIFEWAGK